MSDSTVDEQLSLRPGDVLADRYRVGPLLASGGMGYVVAATHRELGTAFALKVLKVKFARDEMYLARFRREALAAARLRSEHVVRVVDFGRVPGSGAPYLVMEYLDGCDLASAAASAAARGELLPVRDVCDYVIQGCNGLAAAHAAGIVHRDLKPANLFLTRRADGSPCVKVLDFGISKHSAPDDLALTSAREVLGSPLYMSPEQLKSPRAVDARSDIWSLGVILFELLTGRLPFEEKEFGELFMHIQTQPAPPLLSLRPDLPPELGAIVACCLQKDPAARHQSVAELAGKLAAFAPPGAEHHVTSIRQMSRRWAVTQANVDFAQSAEITLLPSARHLPSAGRAGGQLRRVLLASALAGAALGGGWALLLLRGGAKAASAPPGAVALAAPVASIDKARADASSQAAPAADAPSEPPAPATASVAPAASPPAERPGAPPASAKGPGAKRRPAKPSIY
jgi:eukaryotic-like serine/threonine-protein kinase